jgi:hypothetical protein
MVKTSLDRSTLGQVRPTAPIPGGIDACQFLCGVLQQIPREDVFATAIATHFFHQIIQLYVPKDEMGI